MTDATDRANAMIKQAAEDGARRFEAAAAMTIPEQAALQRAVEMLKLGRNGAALSFQNDELDALLAAASHLGVERHEDGWFLPRSALNELQIATLEHFLSHAKRAHEIDCKIRKDGRETLYELDSLKHLVALPAQSGLGVQRPEDVARIVDAQQVNVGSLDWTDDQKEFYEAGARWMQQQIRAALPHTGQPQEGLRGALEKWRAAEQARHDASTAYNARRELMIAERDRGNWSMTVHDEFAAITKTGRAEAEARQELFVALSAAPASPRAEGEWHPIESAPIDGTIIDLWCRSPGINGGDYGRIADCWCSVAKWYRYDEQHGDDMCRTRVHNATHWMPRPSPPVIAEKQTP